MISITIAELKAEIIRSGYTIDKIADMLGIGRKTMYNKMYSKGKKGGFTVAEAKKLAKILDIDVSMFFKEEKLKEFKSEGVTPEEHSKVGGLTLTTPDGKTEVSRERNP